MKITTGIKLTILLPLICLGVLPAAGEVKIYKADEIISTWVSVLPGASEWQADDDSILNDGRIGAVLLCADRECPDNYSFKVDIKNNINDARWFGIICNYQQNSDAYIFRIKVNKLEPEKGAFQFLRRSQNTLSIIATEALVLYSGETYTLELTRKDAAYFSLQIRQGEDILAQKTGVMNDEFLGGRFGFFNDGAPQGTVAWIGAAFHSLNNTGRTFQNNNWDAGWIKPRNNKQTGISKFNKSFYLSKIPFSANFVVSAENVSSVYLNDVKLGDTLSWLEPRSFAAVKPLRLGSNFIECVVNRGSLPASLCAELVLWNTATNCEKIVTDNTWQVFHGEDNTASRVVYIPFINPLAGTPYGPLRYVFGGPLPETQVTNFIMSGKFAPTEKISMRLHFSADPVAFGAEAVKISFLQNGHPFFSVKSIALDKNFGIILPETVVPDWLPTGDYSIAWKREKTAEEWHVLTHKVLTSAVLPPALKAAVVRTNGHTLLCLNGVARQFVGLNLRRPVEVGDEISEFGSVGIDYVCFNYYMGSDWTADGKFNNFEFFDRQVYAVLDKNPEAIIIPFLQVSAPAWWLAENTGELIKYDDEIPAEDSGAHPLRRCKNHSVASEKWLADTQGCLRLLVQHVHRQRYRSAIAGLFLCGTTGEWFYWGAIKETPYYHDYSPQMKKFFQEFLRRKYENKVELLRSSWRDPALDFSTVSVPRKKEWLAGSDVPPFRREISQSLLDYAGAHNECIADAICSLAKTVKEESANTMITGAYYGYINYLPRHTYLLMTGHLALKKVLTNAYIDILDSPQNYAKRGAGGDGMPMTAIDSIRLNGKYWFSENDTRTHLALDSQEAPDARCSTLEETVAVMRRDFALALVKGYGFYWYSVAQPTRLWFSSKEIMEEARRLNQLASRIVPTELFSSSAQVAVIVDEESPKYLHPHGNVLKYLLHEQLLNTLNRTGVAWDCYLSSDLPLIAEKYSIFVFPNLFRISGETKKIIRERICRNGRTVIWCYAAGIIRDNKYSLESMDETIGLRFIQRSTNAGFQYSLNGADPCELPFGELPVVSFTTADKEAQVLARYADKQAAIALKKFSNWSSIWIGPPYADVKTWQAVYQNAGLEPVQNDDDVIYIRHPWIAIHTKSAGSKKIKVPVDWTSASEIFSGKTISIKNGLLKWNARATNTYLFYQGVFK